MKTRKPPFTFAQFAWFVTLYNLFVILWGGYVSISGSGDGCGEQWPFCSQLTATEHTTVETFVEFFHRATSGLSLLFIIALLVWALRRYPKPHPVRQAAVFSFIFVITESILGAGLVIFQWVDTNLSLARAFVQPVHLVNTYLLMGALGLTAWWASGNPKWQGQTNGRLRSMLLPALFGVVLLSAFGTIASLASTIFPSESFFEGVQKDFARDAHYLIRLRIWHPLIATAVGGYLIFLQQWLDRRFASQQLNRLAANVLLLFGLQYGLGVLNAFLLAPPWLQIVHLLLAHLVWLMMVWLTTAVLAQPDAQSNLAPSHAI